MIKKIWEELLNRIYPCGLYCICCGKIIDDSRKYRLCNECMSSLKWTTGQICEKCGKPLSENNPGKLCFYCKEHTHTFDKGYTCTEYGTNERAVVYSMKYDDRPDIARAVGEMMADRMRAAFGPGRLSVEYDLLVPVPVSKKRKAIRGYNQAELLAKFFSELTDVNYKGEVLFRKRDTNRMKGLSPEERKENIRGCFGILPARAEDIEGASCLIIDDIYTTGATVDEISTVLRRGGAQRVDFLSFANGADVLK